MKYIYEIWPSEDPSFKYQYSIHLEGAKRVVNGPMAGRTTETKATLEERLKRTVRRRNADNLFTYRQTMTVKPERVEGMIDAKKGQDFMRHQSYIIGQEEKRAKKNRRGRSNLPKLANAISDSERA